MDDSVSPKDGRPLVEGEGVLLGHAQVHSKKRALFSGPQNCTDYISCVETTCGFFSKALWLLMSRVKKPSHPSCKVVKLDASGDCCLFEVLSEHTPKWKGG